MFLASQQTSCPGPFAEVSDGCSMFSGVLLDVAVTDCSCFTCRSRSGYNSSRVESHCVPRVHVHDYSFPVNCGVIEILGANFSVCVNFVK